MKPSWRNSPGISLLYRCVLFSVWLFFKVFYRHRVYGYEHFYPGAAVIAANHTSFFDPPIVSLSWPQEVHFLARDSLFKNPLFGRFIRALNSHPVSGDGGDAVVFRTVVKLLNEGKKIILFPEGTRSERDELGQIKPGIALLISRTNSAIIPAYIHGAYQIWNRHRSFPKLWGKTACVFGSPILWESYAHLEKKEAQIAIAEKFRESILALRRWYENGAIGTPP
jgi:1-acyl-sn-glycerol-3-phosphate acyltransferase